MANEFPNNCRRCSEFALQGSASQNFEYHCDPAVTLGPLTYWFDIDGARELIAARPRSPSGQTAGPTRASPGGPPRGPRPT